jgi:hypothetical protein
MKSDPYDETGITSDKLIDFISGVLNKKTEPKIRSDE